MFISIAGLLYFVTTNKTEHNADISLHDSEWDYEPIATEIAVTDNSGLTEITNGNTQVEILHPVVKTLSLTTMVKDREPVDNLTFVDANLKMFFVHTSIETDQETSISHVYKFDGEEIARVSINVGISTGWRCWSSKYLDPLWVGEWSVEIQSENGIVLAEKLFKVSKSVIENKPEFKELESLHEELTITN